jgi:hypothetical protein
LIQLVYFSDSLRKESLSFLKLKAFILFKPEKLHSKKPNENGKKGSPFWGDFRNQSVFFQMFIL